MEKRDSTSVEQLAFERGVSLACEIWQAPRILWAQWCNMMIDVWNPLLALHAAHPAYRDAAAMPATAAPTNQAEG